MGEKDLAEKTLEAYNDVFADIVNGLLFDGKPVVSEDELTEATTRSIYKADGSLHEQDRDQAKYWNRGMIRLALYGFENQSEPHPDMPLRLFGYDGASYRAQLLADRDTGHAGPRYPVVTLVLYFGYRKHWDKPRTLLGCLDVPEELRPYINDYKMNLYEIAYLTEEQLGNFHSDFRIVADYFMQLQRRQDYVAPDTTIRHVHEFLQLMSVMTGDNRYEEVYSSDMEGRQVNMCEVLEKVEDRGVQKGIQQGITRGEDSAFTLVSYLLSNGRMDDLKKAAEDNDYRSKLMEELGQR